MMTVPTGDDLQDELAVELARTRAEFAALEARAQRGDVCRTIVEGSPDPISSIGPEGRHLFANCAFAEMVGKPLEEIVGRTVREVFPQPVADQHAAASSEVLRTGKSKTLEVCFPKADCVAYHLATLAPIMDESGRVVSLTCSFRDITARKNAELYKDVGRESLHILNGPGGLREAIQCILDVLKARTGFDAVGLRLKEGNDFPYYAQTGFPDLFLLTENTLLPRGAERSLCRPPGTDSQLECTCGLVITGKPNPLLTPGGTFWTNDSLTMLSIPASDDPRTHPRNRCVHLGYASLALIPIRCKDAIVGLIQLNDQRKNRFTLEGIEVLEAVGSQIGDALMRKSAEAAAREGQRKLELALRSARMGAWSWDLASDRPSFGDTVCALLGLDPRTFTGAAHEFFDVVHPDDRVPVKEALARTLAQDVPYAPEYRVVWPDGSTHFISARAHLVRDDAGHPLRISGILWDVTERRQTEQQTAELQAQLQQARKMESVGRLAGGVAHDFNNMLTAILANVEFALADVGPTGGLRDDLEQIRLAARRSADLTRQLLAFARKQTVAPRVLNFDEAIAGVLVMLRRLVREDVQIEFLPGAALWQVRIDPTQLDQILSNLIVNAGDASSGPGKVRIATGNVALEEAYCATHPESLPGDYVELRVSDDGSGMDEETRSHIFEPFFTTKAMGKGTGLGLATVYGIVTQNHGAIEVQSELGQGTTFKVYLPRYQAMATPLPDRRRSAGPSARSGREAILLVEDEEVILRLTQRMLERLGYVVFGACTSAEALRVAKEHGAELRLLITDVVMPEMNGRELADMLSSVSPQLKCLFMSGYTADIIAEHGVLDDGLHFLQKPFAKQDLAAKVRQALDGE